MHKLWRAYVAGVEAFCFAGVAVILGVAVVQVVFRYVLHNSLVWSEELMRYLMLWVVAVGSGLSFSRGQFLGMRMLVDRLPPEARRIADIVAAVLMLVLLAVVVWYGTVFAWGTRQQSAIALGLSMFWIHVSVVVASALIALHVVLNELFGVAREVRAEDHPMGAEEAL
ncbi:TRAP transporter small permease [Paracoccus sphaerophysae]|uniref:TRAP transporter small permease n=1 Tax=Paracoccus sphaerophysae TaxID=690417 RepID=UPI0023578D34|nr:TRAP transporter small permease [Paracoccus sphaerophysae]